MKDSFTLLKVLLFAFSLLLAFITPPLLDMVNLKVVLNEKEYGSVFQFKNRTNIFLPGKIATGQTQPIADEYLYFAY